MTTNRVVLMLPALLLLASPVCARGTAVVDGAEIRAALELAATRRIDIVGIGDSNQARDGSGWDEGMHVALLDHFDQYASALQTQNENGASGFGAGYEIAVRTAPAWVDGTIALPGGAPAFFAAFCPAFVAGEAFENVHVPAFSDASVDHDGAVRNGLRLTAASPLDVTAALRGSICYGQFAGTGDGGFVPQWRAADGSSLAASPVIASEGYARDAMATTTLDVPADPARAGQLLDFRIVGAGAGYRGRTYTLYLRVEHPTRPAGFSYHTWGAHSGQSLRYFANLIVNNAEGVTDAYKQYYFAQVRRLQTSSPVVIFWINHGLNDRQESLPSVGPDPVADGDSGPAYADNLQGVIDQILADWTASGGDPAGVYFVLDPSHPVANPDDAELESYRDAARLVAQHNPRTAMVDVSRLTDHEEMLAFGDYHAGGADVNHLSASGYHRLARLKLEALLAASCPADLDGDASVGFSDLLRMLAFWGVCEGCPEDLDGSGDVGFTDLLMVLGSWGDC
ncbi:MAG: hypothetical protein HKN62_13145 [Phycisphaerales bacterium]|nr:hypothetical protein [Phycisphaerales bacterium]